jgi:S-DNA-T family DNA segregation ATPase FtsK/SpoIIIE
MRIARRSISDLFVIPLVAAALITLFGLLGLSDGGLLDPWVGFLRRWLGAGALAVPLGGGLAIFVRPRRWDRIVAGELIFFAALGLLSVFGADSLPEAELGRGGGIVGWAIADTLRVVAGSVGRVIVLLIVGAAAGAIALAERPAAQPIAAPEIPADRPPAVKPAARVAKRRVPPEHRKEFKLPQTSTARRGQAEAGLLGSLDFLEAGESHPASAREINQAAGLIEKTLAEFGLPAKVVDFRTGPSVTQFAVEPGYVEHPGADGSVARSKVRVSQISSLANDLALALSAPAIRIEAPVPGKAYVGIEVPNRKPEMVRLRPILESERFRSLGSPLSIALGRDVAGEAIVANLASMPHLLIAGTTGSGKSVCITALTTCLAINNSPDQLRFVLIDPKRVELLRFNGLPHLMGKVETDLTRIAGVLRWCTLEMDRRFKLLEAASARDIASYNRRAARRKDGEGLPRLVIMIDELADLMMLAPDATESALVRLAQMARATGIHLVVATQRPSTDVVTGLIKANFPARIACAVASSVDSRVILDGPGAESLLGKGDMLYLAPEAAAPVRLQGVYVSDSELEGLIRKWSQDAARPPLAPWEDFLVRQDALAQQDDVLERAIELVKQTGEASASLLQRRLRVGYPRAARLMDELEELGLVGRATAGGRTREVLFSDDPPAEDPPPDPEP